jgi:hypothetical protein
MNEINAIHTPCKSCVFAVYDNQTQISCGLDYLAKYKKNNIEILEAYDEEKEFFIVNGKKCIGYRENKWFDQFNLQDASLEEKINQYKKTNQLNYLLIVDLKNMNFDNFQQACENISSLKIKPQKIIFLRYITKELSFTYDAMKKVFSDLNIDCPWRIQTILDTELTQQNILKDITQNNAKYRFITCLNSAYDKINNMIDYTHNLIHEDLGQFIVLSNEDRSCIIYSTSVYRYSMAHDTDILENMDNYKVI